MTKDAKKVALPGDSVALPEEFLPGRHVYEVNGSIRALLAGRVVRDVDKREVSVRPFASTKVPLVGDHVTGQIEAAQSNTASMRIYYLNGKPTEGGFSGVISLREDRPSRGLKRTRVKLGDIVRAKVVSTLNAIIQLSIDDRHGGVVFSLCSNCGRPLSKTNGRAKCVECGSMEDRKFADDFGREVTEP